MTKFFSNTKSLLGGLSLLLLLGACDGAQQSQTTANNDTKVSLNAITFAQWKDKLPGYQPNIVVVDNWATWCSPCIKRFPKMVELDQRYRDKGVDFVSINLDDHEDADALDKAEQFLNEVNATFDNYYMDENVLDAFEKLDLLGIPAVVIYDGKGKERYRLTGDNPNKQFTDEDIEDAVKVLLAEKSQA